MSPKEGTSGISELRNGFSLDAEGAGGIAADITRTHSQPAIDFFKRDTSRVERFFSKISGVERGDQVDCLNPPGARRGNRLHLHDQSNRPSHLKSDQRNHIWHHRRRGHRPRRSGKSETAAWAVRSIASER